MHLQLSEPVKMSCNVISGCAGAVPEGPLSLLRRAMQLQLSVRVVTRHARGVRGVATGMLHITWQHSLSCSHRANM